MDEEEVMSETLDHDNEDTEETESTENEMETEEESTEETTEEEEEEENTMTRSPPVEQVIDLRVSSSHL